MHPHDYNLALGRWSQKDKELKASYSHMRPCLSNTKTRLHGEFRASLIYIMRLCPKGGKGCVCRYMPVIPVLGSRRMVSSRQAWTIELARGAITTDTRGLI